MIASRSSRTRVARARAAVGPTCRIDNATSTRHSGAAFALSRLASSRLPLADSVAGLACVNSSVRSRSSSVEGEQVALVGDDSRLQQRDRGLVAQALDVERAATGHVEQPLPQLRRAGPGVGAADVGVALLGRGQRGAALGTRRGHDELALGAVAERRPPGRAISGITSPALRITTVSPISTPLRLTSPALCRVASSTVDPATFTGAMNANGVTRPVRPTFTRMSSSLVLTSSGGYL